MKENIKRGVKNPIIFTNYRERKYPPLLTLLDSSNNARRLKAPIHSLEDVLYPTRMHCAIRGSLIGKSIRCSSHLVEQPQHGHTVHHGMLTHKTHLSIFGNNELDGFIKPTIVSRGDGAMQKQFCALLPRDGLLHNKQERNNTSG
jgi:hypothetical protein